MSLPCRGFGPSGLKTERRFAASAALLEGWPQNRPNRENLFFNGFVPWKARGNSGFLFSGGKMNLEDRLQKSILNECEKWIVKYHEYHNHLHREWERNNIRITTAPPKEVKIPDYWIKDKKHNPFYVKKNSLAIARSIAKKIKNNTYVPNEPHIKKVPKANGGERIVTVYQIPDTAVSTLFYSTLLKKNKHRFSSFSYAYRNDRNVHFAIQDIAVELSKNSRTFIAEFDFSDFFGSINHAYLFDQLHKDGFLVSAEEENVIKAFLQSRIQGIPQGTSLSLFLANLVCWKLDKNLEREGLAFARYADDTVIFSQSYNNICKAYNAVDSFSRNANVPINIKKSDGINILAKVGSKNEITSKTHFDFLGYGVGIDEISAKEATVKKIKKQISYLLYRNLIQPLKYYPFSAGLIPANNRDRALLVAMSQVRRYLYGGLLHRELWKYVNLRSSSIHFKGVLSYYPLINSERQLSELDGWLVSVIHRTIKKRKNLLIAHGFSLATKNFPFDVRKDSIVSKFRGTRIKGRRLLEIPSFTLFYKAMERGILELGLEQVMHVESSKYNYP